MLKMKQVSPKTYEELMEEAIRDIPLYTREWTNYNPSDPGITILENLSAFNKLQQISIDQITPLIREKLFEISGFKRRPRTLSRVLLKCPHLDQPLMIPANQRFMLGRTPFETKHAVKLSGASLKAVYSKQGDVVFDISTVLDSQIPVTVKPFGDCPAEGNEILLVADNMPAAGEECFFYIETGDDYERNPFPTDEKRYRMFASMTWEVLTEEGYVELASRDGTGCFLESGEVRFRMPEEPFKPLYQNQLETPGYVIKGRLSDQSYDLPPVLKNIHGFLFEVWQKETISACYTFNQNSEVVLTGQLPSQGYVNVFCKEEGQTSYRKYQHSPMDESLLNEGSVIKGRYYFSETDASGKLTVRFNKKFFGYEPARTKNAVRVTAYSENAMRHYKLGSVFGYDNQVIELPFKRIVSDTFSVIAERYDSQGQPMYDFVKPDKHKEGSLVYTIDEDAGTMTILDAGEYAGAQLYLCAVALSLGSDGNIRSGNFFEYSDGGRLMSFTNPSPGVNGCEKETIEELQQRFLADTMRHETAVCAEDFENLVKRTPGLCIHKVKAYESKADHAVHIAVLPYTRTDDLSLSDRYKNEIMAYVEKHRMLGTIVKIDDVYAAPINVELRINVKSHTVNADEKIKACITDFLDARTGDKALGGIIYMEDLYKKLEAQPYVDAVFELVLSSGNRKLASKRDCDIVLLNNCVSIPGQLDIEIMR